MNTQIVKNQPFSLCVNRSYVSCLARGLAHGVENVPALWRCLWPLAVPAALWPMPFALLLVPALAVSLRSWPVHGFVPYAPLGVLWPQVWAATKRYLAWAGMAVVFVLVWAGGLAWMAVAGAPLWAFVAAVAAMGLLCVPLQWAKLEMLFGSAPARKCAGCYVPGLHHMGRLLPFYLLLGLLQCVVGLLSAAPFVVALLVAGQRSQALAVGDVAPVPFHFWILAALGAVLCTVVAVYLLFVTAHAEMLLWGSVTACERGRRSVEEIPADAEAES